MQRQGQGPKIAQLGKVSFYMLTRWATQNAKVRKYDGTHKKQERVQSSCTCTSCNNEYSNSLLKQAKIFFYYFFSYFQYMYNLCNKDYQWFYSLLLSSSPTVFSVFFSAYGYLKIRFFVFAAILLYTKSYVVSTRRKFFSVLLIWISIHFSQAVLYFPFFTSSLVISFLFFSMSTHLYSETLPYRHISFDYILKFDDLAPRVTREIFYPTHNMSYPYFFAIYSFLDQEYRRHGHLSSSSLLRGDHGECSLPISRY